MFMAATFMGATCPIFGLLSKNNTGMAALRASLPVKSITLFRLLQLARDPRSPIYLA